MRMHMQHTWAHAEQTWQGIPVKGGKLVTKWWNDQLIMWGADWYQGIPEDELFDPSAFPPGAGTAPGVRRATENSLVHRIRLDVPLHDLAGDFSEVVLVDIFHSPAVRAWAAQYPNVYLEEADLTGLVESMAEGEIAAEPPLPTFPEADGDLVVSLNLLGQLPLIPLRHVPNKQAKAYGEAIQRQHLRALQALAGRVCLITETHREYIEDGEVDAVEPTLGDIKLPEPDESWLWNLAPAPELERDRDLRLRIAAYSDFFRKIGIF